MTAPFSVPPQNIQAAIEMLYEYTFSQEYLESINYNRELSEDCLMFDISMAVILLGGTLSNKQDLMDVN